MQVDFMPVYAAHLREIIKKGIDHPDNYERPLEGFKIIVDAGNGSGGFLASDVLAPLGADTTGVLLAAQPRHGSMAAPIQALTSHGKYCISVPCHGSMAATTEPLPSHVNM